jgi:energy-converting hydrogenase Eha subunit B
MATTPAVNPPLADPLTGQVRVRLITLAEDTEEQMLVDLVMAVWKIHCIEHISASKCYGTVVEMHACSGPCVNGNIIEHG